MTIAQRVRAYRLAPPYPSLRTVAAELGVSPSYVSEIERGLKHPRGEILGRLARLLGTTPEGLEKDGASVRIQQISATAVGLDVCVACLLSDGSVKIIYPEREQP